MRLFSLSFLFISIWILLSCGQETTTEDAEILKEVRISLDSAKFQHVYDFIDHWQQDSLVPYLSHRDPSFRVLASYGFAAMMDDGYIDDVGEGILDPLVEVRRASVYSLGQSYSVKAVPYLMNVFENQDSTGIDPLTFKYALEAIGKCADSSYLSLLAGITTYQPQDTLLLEGQSLGILNMTERGYSDTAATALMVRYISGGEYASSVRLIAANYLVAAEEMDLKAYDDVLKNAYENEDDPEIRMFYAQTIGRTGDNAGTWIRQAMKNEKDSRVRVALLRGSVALPLPVAHRIWARALRDQDVEVARTAGDLIVEYGSGAYSDTYTNWAFSNFRPMVYARILAAGNRYISNVRFRKMVQELIFQRIRSTSDPYIRSDYITAAGQRLGTARQLPGFDDEEAPPIIRTSILEALVNAVNRTGSIGTIEKEFLIKRWKSGDVAALSILSPFFTTHKSLFPEITGDPELWSAQSEKIKLPEGIEARLQVDEARQALFDYEFDPLFYREESQHTHDIDWNLYEKLSDRPSAEVQTDKGNMIFSFFKEKTPATVVNFIQLAESGYYSGKVIHRVVPNFVIQGGGNRGDGYGSMEYTIRSELGPMYYDESGLVGMASAGPHTESQQWFITLRPTVHLNGRYTQFARITGGREVLEAIRRGDKILNIKIHR